MRLKVYETNLQQSATITGTETITFGENYILMREFVLTRNTLRLLKEEYRGEIVMGLDPHLRGVHPCYPWKQANKTNTQFLNFEISAFKVTAFCSAIVLIERLVKQAD